MKRLAMVALAGLLIGAVSAHAGAARPKTYEGTYNLMAPGACGATTCAYYYDCIDAKSGCALVKLERPAYRLSVEVEDKMAGAVLARVYTLGGNGPIAKVCTTPQEPFSINAHGATELLVHVVAGACEDNTPSTPTSGVVRATRI
jgi:hypothetical protein